MAYPLSARAPGSFEANRTPIPVITVLYAAGGSYMADDVGLALRIKTACIETVL